MKNYELTIEGMGCMMCVKKVTAALEALGATVNECAIGSAKIAFAGDIAAVKDAIKAKGFEVTAVTEK